MQNLLRRGNTLYARLFIPKDRWSDVGRAFGAPSGIKRDLTRTLQTTDRREANKRLGTALGAMRREVDAALKAAGLAPLTDWTAEWEGRAMELRAAVQAADDTPLFSVSEADDGEGEVGESERDLLLEAVREEAMHLKKVRGSAAAGGFYTIAATDTLTVKAASEQWLIEVAKVRRRKTVAGHRALFSNLDLFLGQHYPGLSIASMTFGDLTRRMAGEFIAWRANQVSAAAVQREFSAPMGLWRWAIRRGYTETNPWTDQTAGLGAQTNEPKEDAKRAFTTPELVILLRATGTDWAPNRGGYGAALWDAVRLGLLTGLRAGELADLRIRDLIENQTVISVPKGKTKNARRLVPLPKIAQQVVAMRLADLRDTTLDAPLWPELPYLKLTASRGGKLSDRFGTARERLLPGAVGVDFHSLRRSYATSLETAMNAGGRINSAIISTLMGQARGTLALDLYSAGASLEALTSAVSDMEGRGLGRDVTLALMETMDQRPRMTRFEPVGAGPVVTPERQPKRPRGRPRLLNPAPNPPPG